MGEGRTGRVQRSPGPARDLQQRLAAIVNSQDGSGSFQLDVLDTHNGHRGILGDSALRPDFTLCLKGRNPVPLTTLGFLEIKRTEAVCKPDNVGQAVSYGETLLRLLDARMGRAVLVGVTDLRTMQWVKVYMSEEGHFTYEVPVRDDNARASLYTILRSDWASSLAVPSFSLSTRGGELQVLGFLGSGRGMGQEVSVAGCPCRTQRIL